MTAQISKRGNSSLIVFSAPSSMISLLTGSPPRRDTLVMMSEWPTLVPGLVQRSGVPGDLNILYSAGLLSVLPTPECWVRGAVWFVDLPFLFKGVSASPTRPKCTLKQSRCL